MAEWRVTTKLYVVCVAEKGAGKTPSAKMFMEPLTKLEKEETAAYNIDMSEEKGIGKKIKRTVSHAAVDTSQSDVSTKSNIFQLLGRKK